MCQSMHSETGCVNPGGCLGYYSDPESDEVYAVNRVYDRGHRASSERKLDSESKHQSLAHPKEARRTALAVQCQANTSYSPRDTQENPVNPSSGWRIQRFSV